MVRHDDQTLSDWYWSALCLTAHDWLQGLHGGCRDAWLQAECRASFEYWLAISVEDALPNKTWRRTRVRHLGLGLPEVWWQTKGLQMTKPVNCYLEDSVIFIYGGEGGGYMRNGHSQRRSIQAVLKSSEQHGSEIWLAMCEHNHQFNEWVHDRREHYKRAVAGYTWLNTHARSTEQDLMRYCSKVTQVRGQGIWFTGSIRPWLWGFRPTQDCVYWVCSTLSCMATQWDSWCQYSLLRVTPTIA